jgi:hypothetical protein
MIRDWLHRKEIEKFALDLARDLAHRFPPASENRKDKGARNQLTSITTALYQRGAVFAHARRLGVYGKAKLGNTFRWQLQELGYSASLIDALTHELLISLTPQRR